MAKISAIQWITREAKRLRKKYPRRFKEWRQYVAQASAIYSSKHKGKSPVGKKKPKRKVVKKVARKKHVASKRAVRRHKRHHHWGAVKSHRRRVSGPSTRKRRRVSGEGGGGIGTLGMLALGGLAVYMLTKGSTQTQYPATLPPVSQTQNYTRNTQSQDIVNYAMAAGLTVSAITNLINALNSSSDAEVDNAYTTYQLTGQLPGEWI